MNAPFPSLSHLRWSACAFGLLTVAACGGRASGTGGSAGVSAGATSGAVSGVGSGTVSGSDTGSASGAISVTGADTGAASGVISTSGATSGAVSGATSGAVSGAASGAASGVTMSGSTSGTSGAPSDAGSSSIRPSPGCNATAWTGPLGQWVAQPSTCAQGIGNQGTDGCQTIPPGSTVPATATKGSPEHRGWQVYVPQTYDPSKAYKVIYNGAGCFDPNWFHAGADGLPYQNVDNGNAILVGLDYDTYSDILGCYDSSNPESNDLQFFPWLQNKIESQFCVDTNHEFFSGYDRGASLGQQLDCVFPDKLRGFVAFSGCEPGAPGYPGSQPPCISKPTAALFVHDLNDFDFLYPCILPACARVLKQNGCTTTVCDPSDTTLTTPYTVPAGVAIPAKTGANSGCVSFNGCPADYPVVLCTTANQSKGDGQGFGVQTLFWDFMNRL